MTRQGEILLRHIPLPVPVDLRISADSVHPKFFLRFWVSVRGGPNSDETVTPGIP